MLGAVAGDIIGSVYEFSNGRTKSGKFLLFEPGCDFTDDTVLTVAVADAILGDGDYGKTIKAYARRHPGRGYGGSGMSPTTAWATDRRCGSARWVGRSTL
jgi:ADP-ribosylglycohydrolase